MRRKRKTLRSKHEFLIRRATQTDLLMMIHQYRRMWEDIGFKESSSLDEAERSYRKWAKVQFKNETLLGWIVETRDHVVAGGGCIWLRPALPRPNLPELDEPFLVSMFTEPEFRRSGIASKVVEESIKWCRRKGYRRILLHASKKGRGLYRKYGFTRTWEMRLEVTNK